MLFRSALVLGLALSIWGLGKAERQRRRAEVNEKKAQAEAAKSRQVAQFLKDMLNGVSPSVALGRDTTLLQEILDKTAQRVGQDLNQQPDVGADLRSTIGEVYYALAEYAKAEAMHREAVGVRRKLFGNDNLDLAQSLDDLGVALQKQWKAEDAIRVHREALAIRRKLLGNEHPDVAKSISHLGEALNTDGKFKEAERTLREAVTMQRKLFGDENLDLAVTLIIFANSLRWNDKMSESETVARKALAISRKLLGNEHPEVALSLQVLANTLRLEGKSSEAEDLYRESLALRIKMLGNEHPLVGKALGNLVSLLREEGKLAEVASVCRKLADQGNAEAQVRLGWMYANGTGVAKDPAEAANWYRKAAEHGDVSAQFNLGCMYERGEGVERDPAESAKWFAKAAEAKDLQVLNALAWSLATSRSAKMRDGPHAVAFAEKAVAVTNRKDPQLLDTLAAAYAEAGDFNKAISAQKEAIRLLGDEQARKDFTTRLKLYESNIPYRQGE